MVVTTTANSGLQGVNLAPRGRIYSKQQLMGSGRLGILGTLAARRGGVEAG
jgi:hypothetical protein